jgi:uncharacterized protein (DUF1697 family)
MARQIALLRGINVGKAKRIGMADLRAVFEGLGYSDVRTLLNSGNVVFTSAGAMRSNPASRIEKEIAERLGVSSRVTVLSAAELEGAVRGNPLAKIADNPSRLMVAVLNDPADRSRLRSLARQDWSPEAFAIGARVAYLWCPNGILESPLATALGRELRDAVTSRNWTTMTKLLALASGASNASGD